MKFTLRLKLIVLTTLLVAAIMATVTYLYTIREVRARREAMGSEMERLARGIATLQTLDRLDWDVYSNYIGKLIEVNTDIVYIAIFDDRQLLRAHALNRGLLAGVDDTGALLNWQEADMVRRLDEGLVDQESQAHLFKQTVPIQSGNRVLGSVNVGFWLRELNRERTNGILRNLALAAVFLFAAAGLAVALSRRLTRPLEDLSGAMAGVAAGNLNQTVEVLSRDEIGQLAHTFNDMVVDLRERRVINSLGRELSATFQLDRLARLVRERLGEAVDTRARLFLGLRDTRNLLQEFPADEESPLEIELDGPSQAFLARSGEGFLFDEAPTQLAERLGRAGTGQGALLVPMHLKAQLLGLLVFSRPAAGGVFDAKQRPFAALLARQAAPALENALLYQELADQARLKSELAVARAVQRRLLPLSMPEVEGYSVDGICLPATEVGGDYYDFFTLDDGRLGVVIADVSGKGTSAAFYMAEIKGMMQPLVRIHDSPTKLLTELNRRLYDSLDRRVFASMLYGICDFPRRRFVFARAGHNALLHLTGEGKVELLAPAGIALGLDAGVIFERTLEQRELGMGDGDAVVLYTDGLTDAMNGSLEPFGEERLLAATRSSIGRHGAAGLRQGVLSAVEGFVEGADPFDDLTMVVLRCSAGS